MNSGEEGEGWGGGEGEKVSTDDVMKEALEKRRRITAEQRKVRC